MLIVSIEDQQLQLYQHILSKFLNKHLSWITTANCIPSEKISEEGLSGRNYHVDIQSVNIHFGLWKRLHRIVETKGQPFTRCTLIVPEAIAHWNKNKVFIDVVSRYMLHIKIPFKKANPILQLVVRNIMYLLLNGYLATRYTTCSNKSFNDDTIS